MSIQAAAGIKTVKSHKVTESRYEELGVLSGSKQTGCRGTPFLTLGSIGFQPFSTALGGVRRGCRVRHHCGSQDSIPDKSLWDDSKKRKAAYTCRNSFGMDEDGRIQQLAANMPACPPTMDIAIFR